eukprot:8352794-Pyramimonas_sp.AAC.1
MAAEASAAAGLVAVIGTVAGDESAQSSRNIICDICEFEFYMSQCVNIGSKEYPKYRRKGCVAAAKYYDRAIESNGGNVSKVKSDKDRCRKACVLMRVA